MAVAVAVVPVFSDLSVQVAHRRSARRKDVVIFGDAKSLEAGRRFPDRADEGPVRRLDLGTFLSLIL